MPKTSLQAAKIKAALAKLDYFNDNLTYLDHKLKENASFLAILKQRTTILREYDKTDNDFTDQELERTIREADEAIAQLTLAQKIEYVVFANEQTRKNAINAENARLTALSSIIDVVFSQGNEQNLENLWDALYRMNEQHLKKFYPEEVIELQSSNILAVDDVNVLHRKISDAWGHFESNFKDSQFYKKKLHKKKSEVECLFCK